MRHITGSTHKATRMGQRNGISPIDYRSINQSLGPQMTTRKTQSQKGTRKQGPHSPPQTTRTATKERLAQRDEDYGATSRASRRASRGGPLPSPRTGRLLVQEEPLLLAARFYLPTGSVSIQGRRRPRTYKELHGLDMGLEPSLIGVKDLINRSMEGLGGSLQSFGLGPVQLCKSFGMM